MNSLKKHIELILVSFIILFLELLLIRLVSTEIRIFAYLSNLVLLAIFIGSGAGMLMRKKFSLVVSSGLILLLIIIIVFGLFDNITNWLSPLSESFFWFQSSGDSLFGILAGLFLTTILFSLIAAIFLPLGQILGRLFEKSDQPILAYSLNVAASILGMWTFQASSILYLSPLLGIIISQFLFLLLSARKERWLIVLSIVFMTVIIFGWSGDAKVKTIWSPYQKLTLSNFVGEDLFPSGWLLKVNDVGYMGLLDLSEAYEEKLAKQLEEKGVSNLPQLRFFDQYSLPFILKPDSQEILIIGAGAGNDAAAALRSGITSIDAVEIDPEIVEIGRNYHPEHPYSSAFVKTIITDGRSFLNKTENKYDLIIMSLADSHTLTSSLTNLQLDNYLYTKESFTEIKKILKPNGLLFVSFDVRRPWIGERIQKSIFEGFGHQSLIFSLQDSSLFGWGGVVFVNEKEEGVLNEYLGKNQELRQFIESRQLNFDETINPLSDNWPYLYLDKPRLPKIHLLVFLPLLLILFLSRKIIPFEGKFRWDFFFLGAGFLLYELQNINKIALIFGNTWMINLFEITAVLLFILIANLIRAWRSFPLNILYILLFLSLLGQFFIPLSLLNSLPFIPKVILVLFSLNLPFLFSGLIFISLFADSREEKSVIFASNLLGSAIGGFLGIFSFLFGIKSLLIISSMLYFFSFTKLIKLLNNWFKKHFSIDF